MGVVYPTNKLILGEIPKEGDHEHAAYDALDILQATEGVDYALVYGSVANGTHTRRSDVDVFVIHEQGERVYDNVQIALASFTMSHAVVLEPQLFPKDEPSEVLAERFDDSSYLHHVLDSVGNGLEIGEIDVTDFEPFLVDLTDHEAIRQATIRYLVDKTRGFDAAHNLLPQTSEAAKKLSRAFELPSKVNRKMLQLEHSGGPMEESDALTTAISRVHTLSQRDGEYTQLLEQAVDEQISPEEYGKWINGMYADSIKQAALASRGLAMVLALKRQRA